DVEVLRRRQLSEGPPLADRRITAVRTDHEIRREVVRSLWAVGPHPYDTVLCPDQVTNRGTHVEVEGRVLARLLGDHGEDRRLGDKAGNEAQRLSCDPGSPPASLVDVDRVDDGPRELAEPIPEPHLVDS